MLLFYVASSNVCSGTVSDIKKYNLHQIYGFIFQDQRRLVWFGLIGLTSYRQSESFKDGLPVMQCNHVAVTI